MKTLFVILVCALLSSPVYAFDEWSKTDVGLQVVYTALHIIDWGQTRWLSENYYKETPFVSVLGNTTTFGRKVVTKEEGNFILGKHPSKPAIDIYFASTLLAHAAITHALPKEYRPYWQCITIGLEGTVVGLNASVGAKISF